MKIISWNVNGIRAVAGKGFKEFIASENPDIICVQETKAFEEQFLKEVGEIEGYNYVWHTGTKPGYAGTAIFYKNSINPLDTKNHFGEIEHFHEHGRLTELKIENLRIINGYFPNGGQKVTEENMLDYKLEFYDKIIDYSNKITSSGENLIILGDFNIAHTEIDIARPEDNKNSIGFLPIERNKLSEYLANGYTDAFRQVNGQVKDTYSWWSYRAGARPRNVGWRIDYFFVSNSIKDKIKDCYHLTNVMGSDHCPIVLEINL
ncbi:MAG: exodeoxyribonuclease III [Candidatus Gracilibacteria bacterium]|nr:exodeoxyribonuclease III [Candidatus Gracilibacteria bacterium]